MNKIIEQLKANAQVSDYKINVHKKESFELFYVKGKLETVRRTDTCDQEVTVYVDHDGCKGDSQFFVYPSTTAAQLSQLISEAVGKASAIHNKHYTLPENEQGEYTVESNFAQYEVTDLAAMIAHEVFSANTIENASLNAVEIFINKRTETVCNSRNLHKTQVRYDAMVEAIPTYNGEKQSVELYEQYNFSSLDVKALHQEIAEKMAEVKARYEAVKPAEIAACPVILGEKELSRLFMRIAFDLNYSAVYSHANLFKKGDLIQKAPVHDLITIRMAGEVKGSTRASKFDSDGLSLQDTVIVENGKAVGYFGSNRFGQYLGEIPTGDLGCICAEPGATSPEQFQKGPYLELKSMSGLQVDFFNDYIGGEVRLAYYHDGEKITPVTGISISGKLSDVLNHLQLSSETVTSNSYIGPKQAILSPMKVF